jgi:tetratricopeptide (TPR) repeat protein
MSEEETDPMEGFRSQLQELFVRVRRPTYRSLEAHADQEGRALRTSTIGTLLNGPAIPRRDTVETFVRACARYARAHQIRLPVELVDLDRWHAAYQAMEKALADQAARREQVAGRAVHTRRRGVAVPQHLLPAALACFAGRSDELEMLTGLLNDHARAGATVVISAIIGTAGVGKTTLAVYWAHRVADRFPGGQLYVNLRGFDPADSVMNPAEALRLFLEALGVPAERIPADLDAQATLYRSLLVGRQVLVVLDNARDTAQVRPLLPGARTCLVLVTSRNQLIDLIAADGAHSVTLDLLTVDEARDLLARRLGTERVAGEPEAIDEIITRCARLPLALAIVAARAAANPRLSLDGLVAQLRDGGDRLDMLTTEGPRTGVRAVFSWSYHALSSEAALLFRLLGLHPGPDISGAAVASLAALPPNKVRPLLTELTSAHLVIETTPDRYILHDLLRAYAAEMAHTITPDNQRRAATHRTLDHYLHTAHTAYRLLNPTREPIDLTPPQPGALPETLAQHDQALSWFTAEHTVLLACIDQAYTTGWYTHTWQLAWALANYLSRRGHWDTYVTTGRTALAAAQHLADPTAEAYARRHLGRALTRFGQLNEARTHLYRALDLARHDGNKDVEAQTHIALTIAWGRQDHTEALNHSHHALDLLQSTGDRASEAAVLNNIGWSYSQLGDHEQALVYCERALALQQELGERFGEAGSWDSLGYTHYRLGNLTHALTCYEHALGLFRDLSDRYQEADTLTHIGDAHHATGDNQSARTSWEQAHTILVAIDHPDAELVRAKLASIKPNA